MRIGRWIGVALGLALMGGCATTGSVSAEEDRYLEGPEGPYRGRVVGAGTGRPLAGAIVVAVWQREKKRVEEDLFIGTREAATDEDGAFIIDGTSVETSPPPQTRKPWFLVFARGYTALYPSVASPGGVRSSRLQRAGATIELEPACSPQEREEALALFLDALDHLQFLAVVLMPGTPSAHDLPRLRATVREEMTLFGFRDDGERLTPPRTEAEVAASRARLMAAIPPECAGLKKSQSRVAPLDERYLSGYQGPYHGRLVDEETKAPLAGAVVLGIWEYEELHLFHKARVFLDALEALTDTEGRFVLDPKTIEQTSPERTLRPLFVVYQPGYPSQQAAFTMRGETIELRRLKTRAQRLDGLMGIRPPMTLDEKMPNLLRLISTERRALGLE
jgi:hypothetical protein